MTREEIARELAMLYERRRQQSEEERLRRTAEAIRLDPRIEALTSADTRLLRRQALALLTDPAGAVALAEQARAESQRARQALGERLRALGLPPDYLAPIYACPICRDTGFVGEVIKERCTCYERALHERLYAGACNPGQTFEHFDEELFPADEVCLPGPGGGTQRQLALAARDKCLRYARRYPQTPRLGLVLMGETGLGKTFLLGCVEDLLYRRGFAAVRITAYQAFEAMRGAHMGDEEGQRAFGRLLACPCLLLDDLGSEPLMRNITVEYLFTLLNERLSKRLHTVVATNMAPEDMLARYGERVRSRLLDAMNVEAIRLRGRDLRQLPRARCSAPDEA